MKTPPNFVRLFNQLKKNRPLFVAVDQEGACSAISSGIYGPAKHALFWKELPAGPASNTKELRKYVENGDS